MTISKNPVRRRPGRPKGGDSAATREHILQCAFDLIATRGYRGTSMATVAETACLSQTGLAHHFRTKDVLLAAVLDRRDAIDHADIDAALGGTADGWPYFEALLRLVALNSDRAALVRLFSTVTAEALDEQHPAHGWVERHYADTIARATTALRRGQAMGTVRQDAPVEAIARNTIALMDGLQTQWLLDPTFDMVPAFDAYVSDLRGRWGQAG
ncbi:TetR/AcrR family transcriptional regulator [Arsenicicoccus piscis]|uniref:TetR family transcriptional regulator n=1 Tax=Arsenicicoccus piscis TaxID=673954 RepID=A0ABQ6HI88_9MICO|nr:TetR/AcrR family transcriptional regulator [Arsenicicoccus piscis]MCH8627753.1 TetR/AcrR family transcriptional regulator [Arsenicicoccus piscis]GMA18266.1 TetR family transcriptional regulator [Arsenicicoccus piscis]